MPKPELKIVLGTGTIGDQGDPAVKISNVEQAQPWLDVFRAHGHDTIDTSRRYPAHAPGTSEKLLGQTDIASWATIDTKVLSTPGLHAPEKIQESIRQSYESLKIPKIHINYCHFPDTATSLEDMCTGTAAGVRNGQMEHWGISNYEIEDVEQIASICKTHGYPLPSVYQGLYNALSRNMETTLLPVLRKHNIAYYAYSPAAGGAFSPKTSIRMNDQQSGMGKFFRNLYDKEDLTTAVAHVCDVASKHGLDGHAVALRWVLHHSHLRADKGDGMIITASSPEQLDKTLTACEAGPLPEEVAQVVDSVWETAKLTAPAYTPFMGMRAGKDLSK